MTQMSTLVREACVEGYSQALRADKNILVDRIELCENLEVGGVTPSFGTIKLSRLKCRNSKLFVIIRPRGGDFNYSSEEFEVMKLDIELCRSLGVDGIVTGILTESGKIDLERMRTSVDIAKRMEVTFHMAFDELENPIEGITQCHELGISRILTKGGKGRALDNVENLRKYVEFSRKSQIKILIGGKVTYENVEYLQKETGAEEFHGTRIVRY